MQWTTCHRRHRLEPRQFGPRVLGWNRDISQGNGTGQRGSTPTGAAGDPCLWQGAGTAPHLPGVPAGGLLPKQHFPTVKDRSWMLGAGFEHEKSCSISSGIRTDDGHWNY